MSRGSVEDRAMIGPNGALRVPHSQAAALTFAHDGGFRPERPERFPWRCEAELERDALIGTGFYGVRCVLVDGHNDEHRGEVTWS